MMETRRLILLTALAVLALFFCISFESLAACSGVNAAIVVSDHFGPYITAANAIEKHLAVKCPDAFVSKFFLDQGRDSGFRLNTGSPDIIFTVGTKASMTAHNMFPGILSIFSMVLDPPPVLLDKSNRYGVALDIPCREVLKFLLMLVPQVTRIGVLYTEESENMLDRMAGEIASSGLQLVQILVNSPEHIQERLEEVFRFSDALIAVPDMNIYNSIVAPRIIFEAIRQGKPFVGLSKNFTLSGALFSLDCDYNDIGIQAADLGLEILSGHKPVQKIQYPRKFTAYLNIHTARLIGLMPDKKVLDAFKIIAY